MHLHVSVINFAKPTCTTNHDNSNSPNYRRSMALKDNTILGFPPAEQYKHLQNMYMYTNTLCAYSLTHSLGQSIHGHVHVYMVKFTECLYSPGKQIF